MLCTSSWRLFAIKMIKSVKVFVFSLVKIVTFWFDSNVFKSLDFFIINSMDFNAEYPSLTRFCLFQGCIRNCAFYNPYPWVSDSTPKILNFISFQISWLFIFIMNSMSFNAEFPSLIRSCLLLKILCVFKPLGKAMH